MAGERHGHGMLFVNRPLRLSSSCLRLLFRLPRIRTGLIYRRHFYGVWHY